MVENGGKILLAGFDLDPAEKAIANNTIQNYSHKISEREKFDYIKLRLRKSARGKAYLYEIEGSLKVGKNVMTSKTEGHNLFAVLGEVLEKLLNEMMHKQRTKRQI